MAGADIDIGIFETHVEAEDAIKLLQRAGFDMKTLSIVGQDYHTDEKVIGYFNVADRVRFFGKLGVFWGTLAGILIGSAVLVIPFGANLIVLGPLAAAILEGIEGAAIGGAIGALLGAFESIGIPKDSVLRYRTALKANKYLLLLHGGHDLVQRARETLSRSTRQSAPESVDPDTAKAMPAPKDESDQMRLY
jgi:hypothetical protein